MMSKKAALHDAESAIKKNSKTDLEEAVKKLGQDLQLHSNTLLELVCTKEKDEDCAELLKVLLSHKLHRVNPNAVQSGCMYPIHLIMKKGFEKSLKVLIDIENIKLNVQTYELETGLHLAIKGLNKNYSEEQEKHFMQCMELFLSKIEDKSIVYAKNVGGFTAVCLALQFNFWKICKSLRNINNYLNQNIADQISKIQSQSTEFLEIKNSIKDVEPEDERDLMEEFSSVLKSSKDTLQVEKLEKLLPEIHNNIDQQNYKSDTFLQLAVTHNCKFSVEKLLSFEVDVNATTSRNNYTPAMIAVMRENTEILQLLIKKECDLSLVCEGSLKRTILHIAAITNKKSHCVDILLNTTSSSRKLNINSQDGIGYTALHIAAKKIKHDIVQSLLKAEADIFLTDFEGIPAFSEIPPKIIIDDLLDRKINEPGRSKVEGNTFSNYYYTDLTFNYEFLSQSKINANTTSQITITENTDCERNSLPPTSIKSEMIPLELLADSPNHRLLLKHPVIRAFLCLKWSRVCPLFFANFVFFLIFTTILTCFVIYSIQHNCGSMLYTFTVILLIVFMIRELIQFLMSFPTYIHQIENWLEIFLIILTCVLLISSDSYEEKYWKAVSAFAILVAYIEIFLMIGKHPSSSKYIKMFQAVSFTFLQLLILYLPFILGFSFSFYVLFSKCKSNNAANSNSNSSNSCFFNHSTTSLFKTIIMLTGEFEAESINFEYISTWSHLLFTFFIFFMSIVLVNLLTSLAVGDTQKIINEAEIHSYVALVNTISQIENMFVQSNINCLRCNFFLLMPILKKNNFIFKINLSIHGSKRLEPEHICGCCKECLMVHCFKWCSIGVRRKFTKLCFLIDDVVFDAKKIVDSRGS